VAVIFQLHEARGTAHIAIELLYCEETRVLKSAAWHQQRTCEICVRKNFVRLYQGSSLATFGPAVTRRGIELARLAK
jgi:hypothetical protein